MKGNSKYLLIVLLLLFFIPLSWSVNCNSCATCSAVAGNDSALVNVIASFDATSSDARAICINVTNASVTIDCNSNTIRGGSVNDILINASGDAASANLTVVNCKLEVGMIGLMLNRSGQFNTSNITNNIFLNFSHAIIMGSNVTAYNNTFNDTGLINNTFLNFTLSGPGNTCNGNQFRNNTFVDGGITGSATGDEKAIVFAIGGSCAGNNWTGNTFSMNGPRAFILQVDENAGPGMVSNLFIRNNFLNGSINLSGAADAHFNNSQVGNHYAAYNDTSDNCFRSQTLNDTEYFSTCSVSFNLTMINGTAFENDSLPRVSMFGLYDVRPPHVTVITTANLTNQSATSFLINVSVDDLDTALNQCWVDVNSSGINESKFSCLSNVTVVIARNEITSNITLFVNDSYGNFNSSPLMFFFADFTTPNMSIIFPGNMSNVTSSNVSMNISLVDLGGAQLSTCWYQLNNTGRNITFPCYLNTSVSLTETINGTELPQKGGNWTYNLTLYANDTAGNLNFTDSFVFNVDFNPPHVDSNVSLSLKSGAAPAQFTINVTAHDRILVVDTVRAFIQNPDGNDTVIVTLAENASSGSVFTGIYNGTWDSTNYPEADYFVDIETNDSAGNTKRYDNMGLISLRNTTVDVLTNQSINLTPNITNIIEDVNLIRARLELFPNREVNDTSVTLVSYQQNPTNGSLTSGSRQPVRFMSLTFRNATTPGNVSASTLTIYYNGSEGPATLDTSTFKIFKFLENTSTWDEVVGSFHNTTLDERYNLRSVSVNVTSFSTFAILANTVPAAAAAPVAAVGGGGGGGSGDTSFVREGQTEDLGALTTAFIERSLEKDSAMSFEVAGEKHSIKVKSFDAVEKTVSLEIASDPFTVVMKENEQRLLDITGDAVNDIEVLVGAISGSRATVKVRALDGASTAEPAEKAKESKKSLPIVEQVRKIGEEINKKIRKPNIVAWVGLLGILVVAMVVVWWHRRRKW